MRLPNGEYKTSVLKSRNKEARHPWMVADHIPGHITAFDTWEEAIDFAFNPERPEPAAA